MPLHIPIGQHLTLTEWQCGDCGGTFYDIPQPGIKLCPDCGKSAYQNGELCIYTKHAKEDCSDN